MTPHHRDWTHMDPRNDLLPPELPKSMARFGDMPQETSTSGDIRPMASRTN
jgi:hypothetical protein